ncbi:MAG: alpha/beta fold hydrolase [Pseudomonadota bacterium]
MAEQKSQSRGGAIRKLVERTIQRNINGVAYFVSSDPPVGLTPKDVVHKRGTLSLFHYKPQTDEIYRTPILIVAPTTNRSYCLDMMPGVSFVEYFVRAGYDVFLMDWEPPQPEEKTLDLSDYSQRFIEECIGIVRRISGEDELSLMGYCMGGVLASIYTASYDAQHVRNLICFTTPVDFHEMDMFNKITDQRHFDVDRLVDNVGNIPPSFVLSGFESLEPAGKAASRLQLWEKMWDSQFVETFRKYDRWANDMLPLAGEYFRDTVKDLMWDNKLMDGSLVLNGRSADLAKIKVPFFHAVAEHDNIVRRPASAPLINKVSSKDKTEIVLKGGHVSIVAGGNAVKRLWPNLDDWLSERSV